MFEEESEIEDVNGPWIVEIDSREEILSMRIVDSLKDAVLKVLKLAVG